jgi:hypothetical protein
MVATFLALGVHLFVIVRFWDEENTAYTYNEIYHLYEVGIMGVTYKLVKHLK